jgi:hypothetical protein
MKKEEYSGDERRSERRLKYEYPMRFARASKNFIYRGGLENVNSKAAAFCYKRNEVKKDLKHVEIKAILPYIDADGKEFSYYRIQRKGKVIRIDRIDDKYDRAVILFDTPIPFEPASPTPDKYLQTRSETLEW